METVFESLQFTSFVQLAIATGLGLLLGTERTIAGKNAGMRTYALVSLGSCLLILISVSVSQSFSTVFNFDPLRLAAGIVTGIGFLGAGIIIFKNSSLEGLTTAAGLWVASAIGISVGYGLYALALFSTVLTLFVFTALWFVETKIKSTASSGDTVILDGEEAGRL